ncbi:trihelix transcription factor DF1 [Rosa sericea]
MCRKLGELGYYRSAKKCKEKFENVYKYHRRTKEGRSGKPEGKTYRFFDELEAFDRHQNSHHPSIIPPKPPVVLWTNNNHHHPNQTVPPVVTVPQNGVTPATDPIIHSSTNNFSRPQQIQASQDNTNGFRILNPTNLFSSSTSSTTASDEEFQQRNKRKRKWKYFFRRLTKQVLEKQEKLQETFLEAITKCDEERMVKEEAWRMQEMARIDREHEILVQERSTAAAKDTALIQFLQKVSLQHNSNDNRSLEITDAAILVVPPTNVPRPLPAQPVSWATDQRGLTTSSDLAPRTLEAMKVYSNGENNSVLAAVGSSRWPKTEVQALINLRTSLDVKYQEAGPKGSLWEEISAGMRRLGYNRSSKRCKEKWENINKYFKKVKESSKTRPDDSKTCPYFHQLEALYQKKNKKIEYHKSCIDDRSVEKLQIMQPLRENVDPNQEEDEHDHGEDGESTEEDQEHDHDHGQIYRDSNKLQTVINGDG